MPEEFKVLVNTAIIIRMITALTAMIMMIWVFFGSRPPSFLLPLFLFSLSIHSSREFFLLTRFLMVLYTRRPKRLMPPITRSAITAVR